MEGIVSSPPAYKPLFVAEDDANDALLLKRACAQAGILSPIVHAWNGEEAIAHLSKVVEGSPAALPHSIPELVMLDIKMPRLDGFEVLKWLKSRPDFSGIPAIMFSASSLPADRERARLLGADSYFVKPTAYTDLVGVLKDLRQRWLSH